MHEDDYLKKSYRQEVEEDLWEEEVVAQAVDWAGMVGLVEELEETVVEEETVEMAQSLQQECTREKE